MWRFFLFFKCPHLTAVLTDTLKAYTCTCRMLVHSRMLVLNAFTVVTIYYYNQYFSITGVSVWMTALSTTTYSRCICHWAIKVVMYCILMFCFNSCKRARDGMKYIKKKEKRAHHHTNN